MAHAESWIEDTPAYFHSAHESPVLEEQERAQEAGTQDSDFDFKVEPFLLPREYTVADGVGDHTARSMYGNGERRRERDWGCCTRVLWESFAVYFGMEFFHDRT